MPSSKPTPSGVSSLLLIHKTMIKMPSQVVSKTSSPVFSEISPQLKHLFGQSVAFFGHKWVHEEDHRQFIGVIDA